MILITGATGLLGREVLRFLREHEEQNEDNHEEGGCIGTFHIEIIPCCTMKCWASDGLVPSHPC